MGKGQGYGGGITIVKDYVHLRALAGLEVELEEGRLAARADAVDVVLDDGDVDLRVSGLSLAALGSALTDSAEVKVTCWVRR